MCKLAMATEAHFLILLNKHILTFLSFIRLLRYWNDSESKAGAGTSQIHV